MLCHFQDLYTHQIFFIRSIGITDAGIAEIALGCPALEMINMAYNENVTDVAMISLSKCPRLKAVEIRGCPYVSSIGLSAIARGCRRLTLLDIKKCHNINDNGMLSLAQFSPNLRQVLILLFFLVFEKQPMLMPVVY